MSIHQQHSFIRDSSQMSFFSNNEENTPLLSSDETGFVEPIVVTPLPKKQMFMIGIVTFIGSLFALIF